MKASGEFEAMPKKEALLLGRELEKLQKNLGGIRGMSKRPDAVFILDTKKEHIAVTEANKLKIPVIAVVDTNVDPDVVQYPIPGNDDAIRANALMSRVIAEAVAEGRYISNKRNPQVEAAPKRSAEDEAAFAAAQADARRQAAAAQAARDAKVAAAKAERAEAEAADEAAAATDSASVEAAAEEAPAADVQPLADLGGAAEAGTAADAGADSAADAAPYAGAVRATGTEAPSTKDRVSGRRATKRASDKACVRKQPVDASIVTTRSPTLQPLTPSPRLRTTPVHSPPRGPGSPG